MPASTCRSLFIAAALACMWALSSSAAAQTSSTAATTITNNQFNVDGTLNTARLTPATAGAGAATAAQPMRSIQMQRRFMF